MQNIKSMSAYDVFKLIWGMIPEESEAEDVNYEVVALVNTKSGETEVIYKPKRQKIQLLEHREVIYRIELTSRHELAACLFGRDTFERFIPLHTLLERTKRALFEAHRSDIQKNIESIKFRFPHLA